MTAPVMVDQEYTFNLGGSDSIPFCVCRGSWAIEYSASSWGTLDFQILGPDQTTYLSCLNAVKGANGTTTLSLPSGTYKFVPGAGATGVYAGIKIVQKIV